MITAVVPTRKGSERVISKNTRPFANSSLLEVKLKLLLRLKESGLIQDIVVNSDCEESKVVADKLEVRYVSRSSGLATSTAPITDYWVDVLTNQINTDSSMLCQVTSPLISYSSYERAISDYDGTSLHTVELVKDYIWKGDTALNYNYPNHPRSQDLDKQFWKLNFGIAIINKNEILKYKNLTTPNSQHIILPDNENLDIDNMTEFRLAEQLYNEL